MLAGFPSCKLVKPSHLPSMHKSPAELPSMDPYTNHEAEELKPQVSLPRINLLLGRPVLNGEIHVNAGTRKPLLAEQNFSLWILNTSEEFMRSYLTSPFVNSSRPLRILSLNPSRRAAHCRSFGRSTFWSLDSGHDNSQTMGSHEVCI